MELNTVGIVGTVAAAPQPYHNIYGHKNIYALWVDTTRDSGTVDRILVLFQEQSIDAASFQALPGEDFDAGALAALITEGSTIEVTGQLQTYKYNGTGRTQLFVWGVYMAAAPKDCAQLNTVYMQGAIAKAPKYRETPLGKRITDISVRVRSIFSEGFYSYIPCITWEAMANRAALLEEDATVYLEGRLQSRQYIKETPEGTQQLTTWEVSINRLNTGENQDNGN